METVRIMNVGDKLDWKACENNNRKRVLYVKSRKGIKKL